MPSSALAEAQDLSSLILELRDETEAKRCVAAPIVREMKARRLCRLMAAKELGGWGLPLVEALEVLEALAMAEPAVSWMSWNNIVALIFSRYLQPDVRNMIFGDAETLFAASARPSGRAELSADAYVVNGRWTLVSGCELADWLVLMCMITSDGDVQGGGPGPPGLVFVWVRRDEVEIVDTWHAGGLRGTGSQDVVVRDLRVALERTTVAGAPSTLDSAIGRTPYICTANLGFAAQALGVAQQALATLRELAMTKVSPVAAPLREQAGAQRDFVAQTAAVRAARSYLMRCAQVVWDQSSDSKGPDPDAIGDAFAAVWHAVGIARTTVDLMYAAGGTSSLYEGCRLERAHRDIHAMMRHASAQPVWAEDAGRIKFGLQPTNPAYSI